MNEMGNSWEMIGMMMKYIRHENVDPIFNQIQKNKNGLRLKSGNLLAKIYGPVALSWDPSVLICKNKWRSKSREGKA